MKSISFIISLLLFASCSRYQYLPRATAKKTLEYKRTVCLARGKPLNIPETQVSEKEPPLCLVNNDYQNLMNQNHRITPAVTSSRNIQKDKSVVEKTKYQITQQAKLEKASKYQKLGTGIVLSILGLIAGVLMFSSSVFETSVFGGLLIYASINLLLVLLIITLINFISDEHKRKKGTLNKPARQMKKHEDIPVETPQEKKTDDQPGKPDNDTSEKTVEPVPKKEKGPTNKLKNIFIFTLIANILIWLASRLNIRK